MIRVRQPVSGACGLGRAGLSLVVMADDAEHPLIARIERALDRIEQAAQARAYATDRLERRHAVLRERMAEAVGALDELLAREEARREDA